MIDRLRSGLFAGVARLSRTRKCTILLAVDALLAPAAFATTVALLRDTAGPALPYGAHWLILLRLVLIAAGLSAAFGINRIKLNAYETRAILRTAVYAFAVSLSVAVMVNWAHLPMPGVTAVLFGLMFFTGSIAVRIGMLHGLLWVLRHGHPRRPVLIYGAGNTGMQLAAALMAHDEIRPVAFLDDNRSLHGLTIAGLPVLSPNAVAGIAKARAIDRVLLALPSLSAPKQLQIARRMRRDGIEVQAVPSFAQLIGGASLLESLVPISPDHLLGRDVFRDQTGDWVAHYAGCSVVVTGAGGTIGAELCRQLLAAGVARLVLFEISEFALYTIDKDLRQMDPEGKSEIVAVLGSVTDAALARATLRACRADFIFHAAAYKHVPMVEANPLAGMENNVLGTRIIAEAAQEAGVGRFVLISSDKAVRPTNVMGASKRLAELVVQDLALRSSGTVFSSVRFGNVLGSSGSVVPLFQEQIAQGGPVTVTHRDVTRFFMACAEAVQLVLLAGSYCPDTGPGGGDVFVLDMGSPVRIADLARQMITAAGYSVRDAQTPDGDVEIIETGLRPGEKLHEELLIGAGLLTTPNPKILRAREASLSEIEVAAALRDLRAAIIARDASGARLVASRWVEGYATPQMNKGLHPAFQGDDTRPTRSRNA